MPQTEVLITFYSRCGSTERLALAAAVGAVQARANIRFRRLADISVTGASEESVECKEAFDRMRKEYVTPTEADVLRANAIIFVAQSHCSSSSAEWTEYFDLLTRLHSEGKLDGKIGAAIAANESTVMSFCSAILKLGFIAVPPVSAGRSEGELKAADHIVAHGRKVGTVARALKEASDSVK